MLCFVGFRIFCLVCYKLYSTDRYSYITAPQLLFYLQHWTRLTNIQTNTQARLELTKQGLQNFFEGHPYKLKQNFPSQTYREWFIKLCACGPVSAASNEVPAIDSSLHSFLSAHRVNSSCQAQGARSKAEAQNSHRNRHHLAVQIFWRHLVIIAPLPSTVAAQ